MPKNDSSFRTPSVCPVCGSEVPPRAKACPDCGADERTGWDEDKTRYDGLDLPDHDDKNEFDYEDALREEGLKPRYAPKGVSWFWWVVGIALVLLFIYFETFARFY